MEPFSIIATALLAGAAAGGQDAATAAVRDSYNALRNLLRRKTAATPEAAAAIEAAEAGTDAERLEAALADAGLDDTDELRSAAQALLDRLPNEDPAATRIDLRAAKGVQVGDNNTQTNHW
ncbi:hypothetical protein ACFVMC_32195 [Nocardia sp. NPDC127579]|uniref:hypothetical protein n=1 Tax=Nocardia sp. NPDC127579 TaxID=3345402 RepID=UPI003636FAB4